MGCRHKIVEADGNTGQGDLLETITVFLCCGPLPVSLQLLPRFACPYKLPCFSTFSTSCTQSERTICRVSNNMLPGLRESAKRMGAYRFFPIPALCLRAHGASGAGAQLARHASADKRERPRAAAASMDIEPLGTSKKPWWSIVQSSRSQAQDAGLYSGFTFLQR